MKTTINLVIAVALATGVLQAAKLGNGLEFHTPAGWTVKANKDAAVLLPADLAMEPGGAEPSEMYILGMQAGVADIQNPQLVAVALKESFPADSGMRLVGVPEAFRAAGGKGYLYRYDAVSEGAPVRIQIYIVGLTNGGVAGLVAVARPALLARREATLANVAASVGRPAAAAPVPGTTSGPIAAQWDRRLRGRKLFQFSGYSSNYGSGGYNSQKTLLLGVNGNYEFRRSGSVSVYVDGASGSSASRGADQGNWRIYEQGGKVMLDLVSANNGTETLTLSADGTKTLLNGNRWLVGD